MYMILLFLKQKKIDKALYISDWAFCIIVGIGAFFLSKIVNMWIVLCTMIVLLLILWLMLHFWLKKKGTKIFASL